MLLSESIAAYSSEHSVRNRKSIEELFTTSCAALNVDSSAADHSSRCQGYNWSANTADIQSDNGHPHTGRKICKGSSQKTFIMQVRQKNCPPDLKMAGDSNKIDVRRLQPIGTLPYKVSSSDTLTSIAIQFETTTCELRSLNRLMSQMIFPGQELFIPDPEYSPPAPPTPRSSPHPPLDYATTTGSKPISFESPPTSPPPLSEMTVGSPERVALKPPGHAQRLLKAFTPDLERRTFRKQRSSSPPQQRSGVRHQHDEADLDEDPTLDMECLERFIKVKVKHITDGQGVVNGVLLVTPNAIMFDPDVSDKLVLEKGADSYGMVAPMDTIVSAAMYHDIAAMTIKGQEVKSDKGRDCEDHALTCPSEGVYHAPGCRKRASIIEKLNEEDKHRAICSCDTNTSTGLHANGATTPPTSTSNSTVVDSHCILLDQSEDVHSPPTPPVTPADCNLIDFGLDDPSSRPTPPSPPPPSPPPPTMTQSTAHQSSPPASGAPPSHPASDIDSYASQLADCLVSTATVSLSPVKRSLPLQTVHDSSSLCSSASSSPPRYTEQRSPSHRLFNSLLLSTGTAPSTPTTASAASSTAPRQPHPTQHPLFITLSDGEDLTGESHTELVEDHFSVDRVAVESPRRDHTAKDLSPKNRSPKDHTEDYFAVEEHNASEVRKRTSSDAKEKSIFKRTLKSLPSLGGSFASPNLGSIMSPLSGTFFTSSDSEPNSPNTLFQLNASSTGTSGTSAAGSSSNSANSPSLSRSRPGSQKRVSPSQMLNSVTGTISKAGIDVWNAVTPSDKTDLFRSIEEIVPKPAPLFLNPPLFLCLKIGQPVDPSKISKTHPIASYKSKRHGEYWFSIPREKVDKLYAFFVHWSPNIYDCDDNEAKKRGFVVLSESELQQDDNISIAGEADEDVFDTDSLKSLKKNKLSRQMTKDWEILNVNEMNRRLSEMEEQTVTLPKLSECSYIISEKHLRKLMVSLPARVVDYNWTLLYCTERDGFSLKTVYRKTKDLKAASIIVVQDTNDHIFGSFLTCGIKISDYFYGTGESYLFNFYPEFKKHAWSGKNDFFIKGNVDSLVFGAGGGSYGLWLDSDLYHGRTQTCQTFDNPELCMCQDFTIKGVEIYSLD